MSKHTLAAPAGYAGRRDNMIEHRDAEAQCCNCGNQFDGVYDPEADGFTPTNCPKCGEESDIDWN